MSEGRNRKLLIPFVLPALLVSAGLARAEWKPAEREEFYVIAGRTGFELYTSIGVRGPKAGLGRAIAFTDFKLTWTRDYRPRGSTCTLVSAKPKLTITTRLPKPAEELPPPVRRRWEAFLQGVRAHERMHARFIVELVEKIEAATVGLSVPNDPGCRKIREVMTTRLSALSQEQRQKSLGFDKGELSEGGNVHQLILALVNGD